MQIGLGIGVTFRRKWVPPLTEQIRSLLFNAGQQGVLYDPSDLSALFQDAAGTTPVTGMEQPVGRMLDLSGNGNHASQATTTKRGVVSRRVNLLNNSVLNNSGALPTGWGGAGAVPTGVAPNGDVIYSATTEVSRKYIEQYFSFVAGVTYQIDIEITEVTGQAAFQQTFAVIAGGSSTYKQFGVTVSGVSLVAPGKASLIYTPSSTGTFALRVGAGVQSNSTASISFHSPSLALATDTHLPYQRVNTATDYDDDPNKFPTYIRFDGVDDAYQTNSIDFTGTDKMTVLAGVQWNNFGDTTGHMVVNHNSTGINSFFMAAPTVTVNAISASIWGSSSMSRTEAGLSAGAYTAVLTLVGSLTPASLELRRNSLAVGAPFGSTGGGSFANAPLFIGSQSVGTNRFFNGRIYGLIVAGANYPLAQIEAGELYIKRKMKLP